LLIETTKCVFDTRVSTSPAKILEVLDLFCQIWGSEKSW